MTRSRSIAAAAAAVALALACKLEPGGRCTGDGDCEPGLRCGAEGLCVVADGKDLGASCSVDADCVDWGTCRNHQCVLAPGACLGSGDCPAWRTCTDHACVPVAGKCAFDSDCASWQDCASNACVASPGHCTSAATAAKDCQPWQLCDEATHACVPKTSRCYASADCLAWETCNAQNWCVLAPGRCAVDSDCATASPLETCTATHYCDTVVIWGELGAGAGAVAVASVADPSQPFVGFGPEPVDARVDASGTIVHRVGTSAQALWRFVPDTMAWDQGSSTWTYPPAPLANDVAVATPNCPPTGPIARWTVTAAGAVLHSCTRDRWYGEGDGTTPVFAEPSGWDLLAWTASDTKLLVATPPGTGFLVEDPVQGNAYPTLPGAIPYATAVARASGTGFWVGLLAADGTGELWSIRADAVATRIGAYPAPPAGLAPIGPAVLDVAGTAYVVMGAKIVKLVAGAASAAIAYDPASAPAGANDWASESAPQWWVGPSGPSLVAGP